MCSSLALPWSFGKALDHVRDTRGRARGRSEDMSRFLNELRARPELNDLDDKQSMALAASETRAVRRERGAMGRGCT